MSNHVLSVMKPRSDEDGSMPLSVVLMLTSTPDKATGGQWSQLMDQMKKSKVVNRDAKANLDVASTQIRSKIWIPIKSPKD